MYKFLALVIGIVQVVLSVSFSIEFLKSGSYFFIYSGIIILCLLFVVQCLLIEEDIKASK